MVEQRPNGKPVLDKPIPFKKPAFKHATIISNVIADQKDNMGSIQTKTLEDLVRTEKNSQSETSKSFGIKQTIDFTIQSNELCRKRKSTTEEPVNDVEQSTSTQTHYNSIRSQNFPATSKPAFNVSAFVSPKTQSTGYSFQNTTLNTSNFDFTSARSPFYSGTTSYGGSSAIRESSHKRAKLSPVSSSARTTRTHVRAKPLSSAKRHMVTSNTAKRILSTLGKMSTPVRDSRSLPNTSKSGPSFSEMLKSNSQKEKIDPNRPPAKTLSYSKQATVTKNFRSKVDIINRFNEKTADVSRKSVSFEPTSSAKNNPTAHNDKTTSTSKSILDQPSQPILGSISEKTSPKKASMKMRREKSSMHYSSNTENVDIVNTMPEVTKTNIPLPVVSLPKFNFSVIKPTSSQHTKLSTFSPSVTPIFKTSESKITVQKDNIPFRFSSPDVITSEMPRPSNNDFAFSSPVNLTNSTKPNDRSTPEVAQVQPAQTRKLKGFQPPPEGSWDCQTCMINNKKDSLKCAACTEPKPGTKDKQSIGIEKPQMSSFVSKKLNIPKPPEDSWTCPTCMINNEKDKLKCAACTEPKPGQNPTPVTNTTPSAFNSGKIELKSNFSQSEEGSNLTAAKSEVKTKQLKMKFQQNTDNTWECPTCMIRNKNEVSKCVACNETKPGAEKKDQSVNPSVPTGFSFSTSNTATDGFSFTAQKSTSSSGFSFGTADKNSLSGFTFGGTQTKESSSTGFSFPTLDKKEITNGFSFNHTEKKNDASSFSFRNTGAQDSTSSAIGFASKLAASKDFDEEKKSDGNSSSMFMFKSSVPSSQSSFGFNLNQNKINHATTNSSPLQSNPISTAKEETKPAFPSIADAAKAGFLKVPEVGESKPEERTSGFQFGNATNTEPSFNFSQKSMQQPSSNSENSTSAFSQPAPSFSLPPVNAAPVSNATFNFGSNSTPAAAPDPLTIFDPKPAVQPVFGSATTNVFGNSNSISGTPSFNFGSATTSAPKPPATFNFGSSTVPTFETKPNPFAPAANQSSTASYLETANNEKSNAGSGFSFTAGGPPPTFNFGSSNKPPSFGADTSNAFGQSTPAATPGNLFSIGASQASGGNPFDAGKSSTTGRRQIRKAARRIKK